MVSTLNTEPCGTPLGATTDSLALAFIFTFIILLLKKTSNQPNKQPRKCKKFHAQVPFPPPSSLKFRNLCLLSDYEEISYEASSFEF